MVNRFFLVLAMGLTFNVNANTDVPSLGTKFPVKTNASGEPAFGAAYTYGDDPDGSNYLLNVASNLTNPQECRWNFFSAITGSYLMDWSSSRITSAAIVQVKVEGPEIVSKILASQKKTAAGSSLYFVLANDSNVPVYYLDISDLCTSHPKTFKNLTDDKTCAEF